MARGRSSVGKEKEKERDKDREPDPKYALWIIAAIGKVKGQKQRPSEDRITHILQQVYGLDPQEALEQLELCVKTGKVLKVVFKNKASYKDPAKVPPHMRGAVEKPRDFLELIKEAIENEGDENGCTQQAINSYIVDHHAASLESPGNAQLRVKESLKKGLASEVLIKEGRYYRLASPPKVCTVLGIKISQNIIMSALCENENKTVYVTILTEKIWCTKDNHLVLFRVIFTLSILICEHQTQ